MIEKDHLGDWSPEKVYNGPSQDSNHLDLFQSSLPDNLCEIHQKAAFCMYFFAGKKTENGNYQYFYKKECGAWENK